MAIQELIETLASRLGAAANVRNVYGDPVTAGDRTVIPVAKIAYGLGGGTRPGKRATGEQGEGAGAGAGVRALPAGIVEVTPGGVRFIPVNQARNLALATLAGFAIGFLYARRG